MLYGENSPYAYRSNGTTESVKAISRDDLQTFWATHYAPQNAALLLTGDVSETEARSLVEKYFAPWKAQGTVAPVTVPAPPPPPARP
jgi:zinc protease